MVLDNYILDISRLCVENKVSKLYIFGSALRADFNEKSDIDLVVEIGTTDPIDYANYYFSLKFSLQELLKRPVDLLESKAIKNPLMRENIERSKTLIYGA